MRAKHARQCLDHGDRDFIH